MLCAIRIVTATASKQATSTSGVMADEKPWMEHQDMSGSACGDLKEKREDVEIRDGAECKDCTSTPLTHWCRPQSNAVSSGANHLIRYPDRDLI